LLANHGNPRRDLLLSIRNQNPASAAPDATTGRPVRRVVIDPQMATSAAQMEAQREAMKEEQKSASRKRNHAKKFMMGLE